MRSVLLSRSVVLRALLIAATYTLIGGAYIAWSSTYLASVEPDPSRLVALEIRKGLGFVGVTAAGLFVALVILLGRQKRLRELLLQRSTALARVQGQNNLQMAATAIGHDMKNLLMAVELSHRELGELLTQDTAEEPEALTDARASLQRMRDMATDLMRRGQRQPGQSHRARVDLSRLVEQTTRLVHLFAPQHRCRIDVDTDPDCFVHADAQSLEHLVLNLVLNAVEATSRQGVIEVDVRRGDEVVLTVTDDGPGIDPALRERIFEPFFTTRPVGGTGLGLAVVREVVERHGGTVRVLDAAPRGTTFEVRLPPGDRAVEAPGAAEEEPAPVA
jgi:signal transduction histidine kinase